VLLDIAKNETKAPAAGPANQAGTETHRIEKAPKKANLQGRARDERRLPAEGCPGPGLAPDHPDPPPLDKPPLQALQWG